MRVDVACTCALQAKAVKAREKAVVDAAKDDDEEVQRKREERDAAKRKEEKVWPASHRIMVHNHGAPADWEILSCCLSTAMWRRMRTAV